MIQSLHLQGEDDARIKREYAETYGARRQMIGLDTNIFLRFYLKDDPDQSARARQHADPVALPHKIWATFRS